MLEETDISAKSNNISSTERNAFEDIDSLEELDCISQFLAEPYPGNGKERVILVAELVVVAVTDDSIFSLFLRMILIVDIFQNQCSTNLRLTFNRI
ncbi:hypothetical protein TNCV_2900941 [Trichonephila clavipes]|nr:hypothetical protein TNCV_2900941 [Trichonephila clavipes]